MSLPISIPLLLPQVPDREALWPYLGRIDEKRHYSNFGPLVKELESRLAERFQAHSSHTLQVVTTSSATLGLELALSSLDLPKGSHILVPALTFVATLTAVIRAGHIPVVTDIDPASWLLTPDIAKNVIKESNAKAALVVATFGQPQDTVAWSEFQKSTGIRIVIDAAGAFGSQWVTASDIPVVFSMHATKSLVAGEGGFVVCGDGKTTALIAQLSNFGINLNPDANLPVGQLSYAGSNAKLSEFHAAVGLASLDSWDAQAEKRQTIYAHYRQTLDDACNNAITWQSGDILAAPNTLSIRVGSSAKREYLERICAEKGIGTRRWYQPLLHQHAKKIGPVIHLDTTEADKIATDLIGLPFSVFITTEQIQQIADIVNKVVSNNH